MKQIPNKKCEAGPQHQTDKLQGCPLLPNSHFLRRSEIGIHRPDVGSVQKGRNHELKAPDPRMPMTGSFSYVVLQYVCKNLSNIAVNTD